MIYLLLFILRDKNPIYSEENKNEFNNFLLFIFCKKELILITITGWS